MTRLALPMLRSAVLGGTTFTPAVMPTTPWIFWRREWLAGTLFRGNTSGLRP